MEHPVIVWFRRDLRLADNPALRQAAETGRPVIPVYILDDDEARGGASLWWLHHSLASLDRSLHALGARLLLRRGAAQDTLDALVAETGAAAVYWNRRYTGAGVATDKAIKEALQRRGIEARSFNASLLFEPWTIRNKEGNPYKVFSQFWRSCLASDAPDRPVPAPQSLLAPAHWPPADSLDSWRLLPTRPDWAGGLRATWHPGEAGAAGRLDRFLDQGLDGYGRRRDLPAVAATSMLSPYLHWGEISPRQLWHAVEAAAHHDHARRADADKFLAEMGWREFSYHLLFTNPDLRTAPLRPEFRDFPWDRSHKALLAWQKGMTGYPLVDAGMRQLWHTGWMHNRVRMIAASFLIKHLLLPWQSGEAWFWDCLVDADEASNGASWQWVAGCGADAAPYFRIFNPVIQGRKFDPEGDYIRRWVPELAHRPASAIHEPSGDIDGYPAPIIDHEYARHRALEALKTMKSQSGTEEIA